MRVWHVNLASTNRASFLPACSCLFWLLLACLESAYVWEDLLLAFHMLVGMRVMYEPKSAVAVLLFLSAVKVYCKQSAGVALQQHFLLPCVVFQPVLLS